MNFPRPNWRALALFLLFLALGVVATPGHAQISCGVTSAAPNLSFGNVDLIDGSTPADVSATVNVECTNSSILFSYTVQLCLNIGDGTGGVGHFNPRVMSNALQFQIYRNTAPNIWGSQGQAAAPNPVRWTTTVPPWNILTGNGRTSTTTTMLGRVVMPQTPLAPGSYVNMFSGLHTSVTYTYNGEADCGTSPASNFPFTASATVIKSCIVSADALNFGTVDGLPSSTNIPGQSTVRVKCSPTTAYTVTLTPQNNSTTGAGTMQTTTPGNTNTVPYQLYKDSGRTQPWGNTGSGTVTGTGNGLEQALTVYGRVPSANVRPDTYRDTVTVRVVY